MVASYKDVLGFEIDGNDKIDKQNRSKRSHRDIHYLNQDGMVACNPRDREAAHRAEMEEIATDDINAVTCKKCWSAILRMRDQNRSGNVPADV